MRLKCFICDKEVDTDKHGYGCTSVHGEINAWHYSCWQSEYGEVIRLSHKLKHSLCKYFLQLKVEGKAPTFADKFLEVCGYKTY